MAKRKQAQMFTAGEDLPLFSGTAPTVTIRPFEAAPAGDQPRLFDMPVIAADILARRRAHAALVQQAKEQVE